MSEYITKQQALSELLLSHKDVIYIDKQAAAERIRKLPTIETKQIKYFDEDEKAWAIGEVIAERKEDK